MAGCCTAQSAFKENCVYCCELLYAQFISLTRVILVISICYIKILIIKTVFPGATTTIQQNEYGRGDRRKNRSPPIGVTTTV